ncbi:MAG: lamin tail domain-containing protein [Phycisphaerales bacterium]|jgi:MYXO-CTERM domain-containing protein|nr:lamin tail domain-containing protein [Phycisphaerales bacterium]
MQKAFALAALMGAAAAASADIRITEWMYNSDVGEYFELTNTGNTAVDLTGWVYDDDSRISSPSSATGSSTEGLDLSSFGLVQPGESVVVTEALAIDFRDSWNLPASVRVLGGYANNLGRADEINVFDNGGNLVDRLTFGDQAFPGTIRTADRAGVPLSLAALGANAPAQWGFADVVTGGGPYDLSGVLGGQGYFTNTAGQPGNPGYFFVPAPGSVALLGLGALAAGRRRR